MTLLLVVGALVVLYLCRVLFLSMMASEGDVPSAADLHLPYGSQIVHDEKGCGSGGCWATYMVEPPAGMTPGELERQLGSSQDEVRIPGSFWDPREIGFRTSVVGDLLRVNTDYWTGKFE